MDDILAKHQHLLKVVQETTDQVFSTMLGLTITKPFICVERRAAMRVEGVASMVGMAGAISGNGCLCLSKNFACAIAGRFLMAEYDEVNEEVFDAVAEISNMIVGGLKTALEEEHGPMGLSVPTIVCGENYVTRSPSLGDRMVLTFRCDEEGFSEKFNVLICLISANQDRSYLRELAEFHAQLT